MVIITAKTQDTPPIHAELFDWNPDAAVVCGTNGVEHERLVLRRFGRVYGMVVQLPAQFEKAGEVTVLCGPTNAVLDVGRYPTGVDDTAEELASLIDASPRLLSEADDDVTTKKYGKLLVNLGNIPDAACGVPGRGARVVAAAIDEGKRAVPSRRHSLAAVAGTNGALQEHEPRRCSSTSRQATRSWAARPGRAW